MVNLSKELIRALESDDPCKLGCLIKERKQENYKALQTLLSLDPSIKTEHRTKAIYALGRWGDPAPVTAIRSILPHLDEAGRITAIDALGRLGTQEALTGVLNYANDSSPHVRKFVTRALGRINTPKARAKLKKIKAKDPVKYIRTLASECLKSN